MLNFLSSTQFDFGNLMETVCFLIHARNDGSTVESLIWNKLKTDESLKKRLWNKFNELSKM